MIGRLVWYGFFLAFAGLIVANLEPMLPDDSRPAAIVRLVAGIVLSAEGLAVSLDWSGARRVLVETALLKLGRGRLWRHALGPVAFVFALVFVVFGVVELIRSAQTGLF